MNANHVVNLEIGDKEWEGVYSNLVIITHSNSEFIIDFARMLPGARKAKVFSATFHAFSRSFQPHTSRRPL